MTAFSYLAGMMEPELFEKVFDESPLLGNDAFVARYMQLYACKYGETAAGFVWWKDMFEEVFQRPYEGLSR